MFRTLIATLTFAVLALPASAVTFQHVCTSLAVCDNDADFSFAITLDDSVVSANGSYNTTSDDGAAVLGWTGSSSVGDGFMISGGFSDIDGAPNGLNFSFDDAGILTDINQNPDGLGFNFSFSGVGGIIFFNNTLDFIGRTDCNVTIFCNADDTDQFAANWSVAPVPLPAGGILLLSALGGIAALRRRKKSTV